MRVEFEKADFKGREGYFSINCIFGANPAYGWYAGSIRSKNGKWLVSIQLRRNSSERTTATLDSLELAKSYVLTIVRLAGN